MRFFYRFVFLLIPNLPFLLLYAVFTATYAYAIDRVTEEFKEELIEFYRAKIKNFVAIVFWLWLTLNIIF